MIESGLIQHLQDDASVSALNSDRVYLGSGREDDDTSISINLIGLSPHRVTNGGVALIESTYTFDVRAESKLDLAILAKAVTDSLDNLDEEVGGETVDRILLESASDSFETEGKRFGRSLTFKIFHY